MSKVFDFLSKPDFPLDANILDEIQEQYKMYERVISTLYPNGRYIVDGCELVGGNYIPGLLINYGELIKFTGGDSYVPAYISVEESVTTINVGVDSWNISTQRTATTSDDNSLITLLSDFKRIKPVITKSNYYFKTFIPTNVAGITLQSGSSAFTPYFTNIKFKIDVIMQNIADPMEIVNIINWEAIWGVGDYSFSDINQKCGTYRLLMRINTGVVKEQHAGDIVLSNTINHLILIRPYTLGTFENYLAATFADLSIGAAGSYSEYTIEGQVQLFKNTIKEY